MVENITTAKKEEERAGRQSKEGDWELAVGVFLSPPARDYTKGNLVRDFRNIT